MEEIQKIKPRLSNIEQSVKALALFTTSCPISGLTGINQ